MENISIYSAASSSLVSTTGLPLNAGQMAEAAFLKFLKNLASHSCFKWRMSPLELQTAVKRGSVTSCIFIFKLFFLNSRQVDNFSGALFMLYKLLYT